MTRPACPEKDLYSSWTLPRLRSELIHYPDFRSLMGVQRVHVLQSFSETFLLRPSSATVLIEGDEIIKHPDGMRRRQGRTHLDDLLELKAMWVWMLHALPGMRNRFDQHSDSVGLKGL